ncbi:MAG TPA: DMT family transporter [Polyangiales bacterium]|nr:DMT family transporter [Polyangiales bacterium]
MDARQQDRRHLRGHAEHPEAGRRTSYLRVQSRTALLTHPHRKAWLQLHLCIVLWGFTAILGKLISLPALSLVFWRMLVVSGLLALTPRVWRGVRGMPARALAIYAGIGVVVALHWVTFYGAVKLANASIGATCMALFSVFASLVEPALTGGRFQPRELVLGLAVVPGVALVVGGTPHGMRLGIAVGALSALCAAVFTVLNKRFGGDTDALSVTGIELGAGAMALGALGIVLPPEHAPWVIPDARDAALLGVLAVGCTLLPFALWLVVLRRLSAFSTALAVNLEPVYAVILASVLLAEQRELAPSFYVGVAIVLAVVFGYPFVTRPGLGEQTKRN